jgi:hypothetical protein
MVLWNQVQEFRIVWYFVPGYNDAYAIGSNGSVWSHYVRIGRIYVIGGVDDWREMNSSPDTAGYLICTLYFNKVAKTVKVHQLVAQAFLGPCPPGLEVCHEDGDRENNNVCNLRYDTRKNNHHDRYKHGTHYRGERHPNVFLTQVIVDLIREEHATGKYTLKQLGEKYEVTGENIGYIVRNKTWIKYEE